MGSLAVVALCEILHGPVYPAAECWSSMVQCILQQSVGLPWSSVSCSRVLGLVDPVYPVAEFLPPWSNVSCSRVLGLCWVSRVEVLVAVIRLVAVVDMLYAG